MYTSAVKSDTPDKSRPPKIGVVSFESTGKLQAFHTGEVINGDLVSTRLFKTRFSNSAWLVGILFAEACISNTSSLFMKTSKAGLAALRASTEKGSISGGAVLKRRTVLGSSPFKASSIRTDSKSPSFGA